MNNEQQFDFYWQEIFNGLKWTPIEFSVYRFDESLSLPKKFNKLYEMFKQLALNNQQVMDFMKNFVETFDSNLYESVTDILDEWAKTGKFDQLIEEKFGEDLKEMIASIQTLDNEKASKEYVDNIASSLSSGSPTEWFETVTDLQAKYPNGNTGTFLVGLQDGQKYIYLYIDGEWKNVSTYPNSNIALKSVNIPRTTFINPKVNGLNNVTVSTLHANLGNGTNISSESLSNTSIYFPIVGGKSFAFRKLSTTYFIVGTTEGITQSKDQNEQMTQEKDSTNDTTRNTDQDKDSQRILKGYQSLGSKGKLLEEYQNVFSDTLSNFAYCFDNLFRHVY